MVAVDVPDLSHAENRGQLDLKGALCLQVAQENDGGRTILFNHVDDMLEASVRVAEEVDHGDGSRHASRRRPRIAMRSPVEIELPPARQSGLRTSSAVTPWAASKSARLKAS